MIRAKLLRRVSKKFNAPAHCSDRKSITLCIFKPDRLGDFVLALGAIRFLVDRAGSENCTLVISDHARELAEIEFPRVKRIVVPAYGVELRPSMLWGALKCRLELSRYHFGDVVCLRHQRTRFQNLMLHWIDTDRAYGLGNQPRYNLGAADEFKFANQDEYPEACSKGLCREIEAHEIVLGRLLTENISRGSLLPRISRNRSGGGTALLVSPFASAKVKDIPEDTLTRVLTLVQKEFHFPINLCSTKDQAIRVRELSSRLQSNGIEVRTMITNGLEEFLDLVSGAKAVLSPDTATAHIAAAFDLPTVAVLGGGHPSQYGPWWNSERQAWVENRQPCAGCDWLCTQPQPYCVTTITPESIVDAMREVLRHAE